MKKKFMFLSSAILFGGMLLFASDSTMVEYDGITGSCGDELTPCAFSCAGCGAVHVPTDVSIEKGPAYNLSGSCRACGYTY